MHSTQRLPQLSLRLAMAARLVPQGAAAADIGSDHAQLPVYLVRKGISPRVIAADIGEGPLENARRTVQRAGLQHAIELRLSDGFSQFTAADAQCWILAGMGGTLMVRLLEPVHWLRQEGTVIVAQPMRRAYELRRWLAANGFRIEQEDCCCDAGHNYLALRAVYSGKACHCPPGYAYSGELPACGTALAQEMILHEINMLQVRIKALQASGQSPGELEHVLGEYNGLRARYLSGH